MSSSPKCWMTRSRPAWPSRQARSRSSSTRPMARARAAGSRGATSRPVAPSSTASGMPPTRVATTGTPAAMDSSAVLGMPSLSEGSTETATWDRTSATSFRAPEASDVDAVADHPDLRGVVPLGDERLSDRLGVRQNAVRQAADVSVHAPLKRRVHLAHAADGCHHDGHAGEPAGRDGEHVAVEVVAVNDVDAVPAYVVRQPRLLPQRSQIVEALDGVRRHRDAARLEERQEPAGAIEAGEADGEFREVEPVDQVHHLAFRPSLGEDGQELQEIDRWHGPIPYPRSGGRAPDSWTAITAT